MFERFNDRARRAVVLAQEQSRYLGHEQIDVGHLILAVVKENADELAAVEHPVDLKPVRAAILEHLGPRQRDTRPAGHIPFTTEMKIALEQGQRTALFDHRNDIDDYDLLSAALSHLTTIRVLTAAGVDEQALRSAVLAAQRRRPPAESTTMETGRGRMSGRSAPFTGGPILTDRSGEIADLLRQVLGRLDTIIERIDNDH